MENYIGKKLEGRYEILELIGFGGMAFVYKAYDILEKRYAAVKILKDEYLQNEDFKRRFRNESKAIALLSHPNIVKVYDVNFSENIQYIVMEYIDGITLKEYIERKKVVGWKEAVHFTVQILRALQHAHDNGIVHRDIKPQNVMLLEDGTIKVMDFGIARFARENGKTMSEKAIGSVHYISPEQAQGASTDERTDVYAVGVMMYEMLTGQVPFDGDTPVSIAIKQMQQEPERPIKINPNIPVGLEEIILRAMQKDPELRYQTASEMLKDIDEFKQNPDVVFEYRYLNQDGTTKYFDKVDPAALERGYDDEDEDEEPKKRSYTINILAGVAAACVILAGIALYFFFKATDQKVAEFPMPNLVGANFEEAQEAYPNLKIVKNKEEASADYDVNVITRQDIAEGTNVKVGAEVLVTVSAGMQTYVVEDFTNELFSTVRAKLESHGLSVNPIEAYNDDGVASGLVVSTSPGEGTTLKKGDQITVVVSLGPRDLPVYVPNVLGNTLIEAKAELAKNGLSVGRTEEVNSDRPKGEVVGQSPDPTEKVPKGTAITLQVSNGIPPASNMEFSIPFPAGLDDANVTFDVFLNGMQLGAYTLNPSYGDPLEFELQVENDLVNGVAPIYEENELVIRVGNLDFAMYSINFFENSFAMTLSPRYSLLSIYGYPNDDYTSDPWGNNDTSDPYWNNWWGGDEMSDPYDGWGYPIG